MGQRGPSKKPTELVLLEGNPGQRKLPENEPKPKANRVACPSWLGKRAKRIWRKHAAELSALGLLTNSDVESFAAWCQAAAEFAEATEQIERHGLIVTMATDKGIWEQPSSWLTVRRRALEIMRAYGSRFGMTPGDRAGLNVAPKKSEESAAERLKKRREEMERKAREKQENAG